jgi:6-phosphogluconolactonase
METIADDREVAEQKAADIIIGSVVRLLGSKSAVTLGLVGGTSVPGVLRALRGSEMSWDRVHIFMADERLVDIESAQSNFRVVEEALVDGLLESGRIPEENLHPFIYSGELTEDLSAYEAELKEVSDGLDIVLLSAGEDGHVAALFPNHETVKSESPYFISTGISPKPPAGRMSASRKLLSGSKVAVVLFFGNGKKPALGMLGDPNVTVIQCPAKLVLETAEPHVITDIK